ncbi:His-Xaa-Ser system protein HxsD [Clostridium sp. PL3]|uniref:His-Xaa-Ser system protein HxsD n=1 Tax=Clostridium thailandense TaxID=2794346 RepID=A0A949WTF9_9CLOT|nr:His-Xaa-Ser system protein HxsD [Clostridium thailandense]MBV7276156.1 His-Xaa-Ser system protein HxsD [Clostridium thailandense]
MNNITHVVEKDKTIFYINDQIYSLTVVMKTAYMFIDKLYIYFDYEKANVLRVEFTAKQKHDKDYMEKMVGEFYNELLNQALRLKIFEKTKNIRELILGRALYNTCIETEETENLNEELNCFDMDEKDLELQYTEEDILNISEPWQIKDTGERL